MRFSGTSRLQSRDAVPLRAVSYTASKRGAVLLEVILALVLFTAAAAIIGAGLNASLGGLERLRLNTHAANIAVSVLSELQLGIKSLTVSGPQPYEAPLEGWTWEAVATPLQAEWAGPGQLKAVEIIVRHDEPPSVYRLSQIIRLPEKVPASASTGHLESVPLLAGKTGGLE